MAVSLVTGGLAYRRGERLGAWLAGVTFVAGLVGLRHPLPVAALGTWDAADS